MLKFSLEINFTLKPFCYYQLQNQKERRRYLRYLNLTSDSFQTTEVIYARFFDKKAVTGNFTHKRLYCPQSSIKMLISLLTSCWIGLKLSWLQMHSNFSFKQWTVTRVSLSQKRLLWSTKLNGTLPVEKLPCVSRKNSFGSYLPFN